MQRNMLLVGRAAMACAALILFTSLLSKGGQKSSLLEQKSAGAEFQELFIVPEANVLTGAGQRPVSHHVKKGPSAASTSSQHAAHAVSKGSAHKAAPAPKPVAKPWTKAQMQVAQNVRKAMMSQHESLEKAARDSAEKQYWSRIKASLAHERHRLRGFRGREAMYQARKALQDEEASDADLAITKTRQQKLRNKIDEMSSEKARSFHPLSACDTLEQRQEDEDAYHAIESHRIDYTKCGDACKTASRIVAGEIVC
ncbi:hypothetical protein GUITHDRAFT_165038 [Guillardia theta CCMP2712]|uniref:Uncharacterized protein n=1 Tax=Guillardia theta (strain CCMP2712) TaxID=905079 RepID=L1ITF5_GUITC|nr:hypothetical protein GUITHDRAFT_165038 [Guillardia theta CCMP2712]EKX39120.1 hypothetical protein GUITHDRAFT_165038 [Guillardia theta CCMP2712]|eukprot:XP_005826100.1 hypothetical protein GUITHDRAFT_165038 [Guillardia theta CCMP2712]